MGPCNSSLSEWNYRGRVGVGKLRPAGHMRPSVSFCAARTRLCTAVFNLCGRVHYRIK